MIDTPAFRACFSVVPIAGQGLLVLTETDHRLLQGHVERLAPWLNGAHTTDEIVARFRGVIPPEEVYYTLLQLEEGGYLVEAGSSLPVREAVYWDGLRVETGQVAERLREARVRVAAFGRVDTQPFAEALKALHIQTGADGTPAVVLAEDYLHEALAAYNRDAVRHERPYLLVKPVGAVIWIGPLIVPGRTGCWACLAHRLRLHQPAVSSLRGSNGAAASVALPVAGLPSTVQTAMQMAATETAKWIVQGNNDRLEGTLVTFDTRTLETRTHRLVRRPQCRCCGDGSQTRLPAGRPLELVSQKKRFTDDGGHRSVPPEVTLRTYAHHVSPLTGIVRRLKRLSDATDPLIHSYAAGHTMASRFEGAEAIRKNLRDASGGKGKTDLQARASGLCEALERFSGIYQADEVTCLGTFRALGEEAIHPNECMGFSDLQYRNRDALNAAALSRAQWIPEAFDQEREIEWTPVWSLAQETVRYLPTAHCYFGYPPEKSSYCRADSNGNAAGNTLEEAILQGFMELVERDSVALWWYNRVPRPGVDLDSFADPYVEALRTYYGSIGRELWVLDVTADLGIPAFAALSRRTDQPREDILFGFGAHFDPRLGIARALTEMNQVLPTVLQIREDEQKRPVYPDRLAMRWWEQATLENQPYLVPQPESPRKGVADYAYRVKDDLLDDITECLEVVQRAGMDLLVLDQTRPDVGMPVVKVIVPGLRHYWPRFGPGRLFDVPVRQRWLDAAREESQLNPFPIFF
ncbi:MAG: TOMM precursor leader peptide-binding protein [Rhodothermales bacterium]